MSIRARAFFVTYRKKYNELLITIRYRHSNGATTWSDYVVPTIGLDGVTGEKP